MAKRKTNTKKRATVGEKIADGVARWCEGTGCFVSGRGNHTELAHRIDSAISRAVRKERERCIQSVRACVAPGALFDCIATEIRRTPR